MSFNITSDGSPTPRKGNTRFSKAAGDLKIDTSPERLGQAVGGFSQNHYPLTLYCPAGASLTANMQGAKRPLGASTLSNQHRMVPQQNPFEGNKVSECPIQVYHLFQNSVFVVLATIPAMPLRVTLIVMSSLIILEAQVRWSRRFDCHGLAATAP
jgi:hypothetical protein